jgi:TonB-dependent SusC/RagA subfamily outer membrane receptor
MTVTGVVTSGAQPVRGGSVSIPALDLTTRTNNDGRYTLLVRISQVRGQTVAVVARHSRYGSQTTQLALVGGSVELNFVLSTVDKPPVMMTPSATPAQPAMPSRGMDSSSFDGAGPIDPASALVARIPGLVVTPASQGGSAYMVFRGARSIAGPTQPLVVVDGIVIDNTSHTTALQQFGLGGFDYGTPLQDIALDDIGTVTLLHGATAVPLYGSRAANGVMFITTRPGGSMRGFDVTASVRYFGESHGRLPAFQNRYGQGLGGQFEFFDGRGGGVNDDIDQSWGPLLDGRPIAQASLTEPGRPDVRHWLPHPSGARNYFEGGQTVDASVALQTTRQWASGRAALHARNVSGITPNSSARRLGLTLGGSAQPATRVNARASLMIIDAGADNRPGTGFDEVNPVSGFTRMGRQVDVDALRDPLTVGNEQINWIYTARNNPFFQALRNDNRDTRTQVIGGASFKVDVGVGVSATVNASITDTREVRRVTVVEGWRSLYPSALGLRDFSSGGTEQRTIDNGERSFGLTLASSPRRRLGFDFAPAVGIERRSTSFDVVTGVADVAALSATQSSALDNTAVFLVSSLSRAKFFLDAGARLEQSSVFPKELGTAIFPSVAMTYDATTAARAVSGQVASARIRASLWSAGSEISPRVLQQTFAGGGTAADPTLGVSSDSMAIPERTTGIEVGTTVAVAGERIALDFSWYREKSRELLVPAAASVVQTGAMTNTGFETQLRLAALHGPAGEPGARWDLVASFGHNSNTVDELVAGTPALALSPSLWGASLAARTGAPLGLIAGTRYLRDPGTGALILRNGLPLPDTGTFVFGSVYPKWTSSLRTTARFGSLEFGLLLDARMGGKVFSATNLWGTFAGTLESTLLGRETGLLIPGLDSLTGAANTDSVTAEDYFHSLASIHEASVYDANYWKLRDARVGYALPMSLVPGFRDYVLRITIIGRNLASSAKAPNIDPETTLSTRAFQGFEMGQLAATKSVGLQVSIAP